MKICFEDNLLVWVCDDCEYHFALWSPVHKELIFGQQIASYCPQCGCGRLTEYKDEELEE